jgi:hypothetical protein
MNRKFWIAAAILAMALLLVPPQANAQVRFGVTIGDPYLYPSYPYAYPYYTTYPYYSGPTYVYRYPAYRYYAPNPGVTYYNFRYGRDFDRRDGRHHRNRHH